MATRRRYGIVIATLLLLSLAYLCWRSVPRGASAQILSVVFIGTTNSPILKMGSIPVEVCSGATGLCALFRVTNTASKQSVVWFKTASVEEKTMTGWQPFVPRSVVWSGVEGSGWPAGYVYVYAVGWPPGLSTNASWRLQVPYRRKSFPLASIINHLLRREIFKNDQPDSIAVSTEVKQ